MEGRKEKGKKGRKRRYVRNKEKRVRKYSNPLSMPLPGQWL
jgi:hypothetical protein